MKLNLTLNMADIIKNRGRQISCIWKWDHGSKGWETVTYICMLAIWVKNISNPYVHSTYGSQVLRKIFGRIWMFVFQQSIIKTKERRYSSDSRNRVNRYLWRNNSREASPSQLIFYFEAKISKKNYTPCADINLTTDRLTLLKMLPLFLEMFGKHMKM